MINYLEDYFSHYTVHIDPPKRLPRRTLSGYGAKIATSYVVRFAHTTRKHRVYATCYSNQASFWVLIGGDKYHLQSWDFDRHNDETARELAAEIKAEKDVS
jgi:hypothetical protein